ncbi:MULTISPECIES: hypothetical protein [unclassified Mesorhizobium]|uniref:hypothetical protein n=1 Tax=unclassified Mesorhizobium TaxID=325217 RepID=UPI00167A66A3|nr:MULTISPECIES: hypothetical protein [unclassified Mesorhizobium]
MPRAGGVYSAPPGTKGTPNTPIESAKYNALVDDLVGDANAARPVTAGGSGSSTAVGAADNFNAAGADMASAATVNLANTTGTLVNITGTVPITALGTLPAGAERDLVFAASLTLTHNATSLILPGGGNITTAAGDVARMRSLGGGNWRCFGYTRANGTPLAIAASSSIATPTLTLKQSAAPTPTAEGDIQWDTDDNVLVVGDGAAQQIFVPLPSGAVAGDLLYLSGAKAYTRIPKGTAAQQLRMNAGATAPEWFTPDTSGIAKAWVSFTVSGSTVTVRKSFNVSSVVRNASMDYTINFTNAMADANYAVAGASKPQAATEAWGVAPFSVASLLVGSVRVITKPAGVSGDAEFVSVVIYD